MNPQIDHLMRIYDEIYKWQRIASLATAIAVLLGIAWAVTVTVLVCR